MTRTKTNLKTHIVLLVFLLLDLSLPILGFSTFVYLTPLYLLYLISKEKDPKQYLPYVLMLDLTEANILFGFYTLFFVTIMLIFGILKSAFSNTLLSVFFYLFLYISYYLISGISISILNLVGIALSYLLFHVLFRLLDL